MTIEEKAKEKLKTLIKKEGGSNRLIEDYNHAIDSKGTFGYHISKLRKIKNGYSFEYHFASSHNSKYNFTDICKINKNRGYWDYEEGDDER